MKILPQTGNDAVKTLAKLVKPIKTIANSEAIKKIVEEKRASEGGLYDVGNLLDIATLALDKNPHEVLVIIGLLEGAKNLDKFCAEITTLEVMEKLFNLVTDEETVDLFFSLLSKLKSFGSAMENTEETETK